MYALCVVFEKVVLGLEVRLLLQRTMYRARSSSGRGVWRFSVSKKLGWKLLGTAASYSRLVTYPMILSGIACKPETLPKGVCQIYSLLRARITQHGIVHDQDLYHVHSTD